MADLSMEEVQLLNQTICDGLDSRDPVRFKEAEDALEDFTRLKMREKGFARNILPIQKVTNDQLDMQQHTSKPYKVFEMEIDSPAAVSVPLGTTPRQYWIKSRRYAVGFSRILTPKFQVDVDELRTYRMDIRQVLSDNAIKDLLTEEDTKFLGQIDEMLIGAGMTQPFTGSVLYQQLSGGITRDSLWDSLKVLPNTPLSLEVQTILLNHITIKEYAKFPRDEMGGDLSADVMKNGVGVLEDVTGRRWISTIKKGLVPTNHVYHFADPKFMGKFLALADTTMYMRREHFMLEFWGYVYNGMTIANIGSAAHIHFT